MRAIRVIACVLLLTMSAAAAPHVLTFKGAVLAVETAAIKINAIDPKTKKAAPKTFIVDELTKVLRGDKVVKYADARIQKGETISVTVDHDLDEELAQIIRLPAAK